jgi:hypothetical protein
MALLEVQTFTHFKTRAGEVWVDGVRSTSEVGRCRDRG